MTIEELRRYAAEEIMGWETATTCETCDGNGEYWGGPGHQSRHGCEDCSTLGIVYHEYYAWRSDTDYDQLRMVEEKVYGGSLWQELNLIYLERLMNSKEPELLARLRLAVQAHQAQETS